MATSLDLSWTVKVTPGEFFTNEESKHRLSEALDNLIQRTENANGRLAATLAGWPDAKNQLIAFKQLIPCLSDLSIPRNRKAAPDLTFATLAFKHFPCELTAAFLKLSVKPPGQTSAKKLKAMEEHTDFAALGDDPIKLARGERGFVFRAFTALPKWNPTSPGEPVWTEFDIAAFKEALKSLNQFSTKTEERERAQTQAEGRLAIQLGGELPGWKPDTDESGEATERPIQLDPTLFKLARALEARLSLDLADTVLGESQTRAFGSASYTFRSGEWRISQASLRGLRDIAPKWHSILVKQKSSTEADLISSLQLVVKEYQQGEKNKKSIGSLPLLLALCEPEFWPLWRLPDASGSEDELAEQSEPLDFNRFLYSMADFHNSVRDFDRSLEPINLTPAEPIHSRRLYMFSDVNNKVAKVKFCQARPSPTLSQPDRKLELVECAIAYFTAEGSVHPQRIRLGYTAPRLRRDALQTDAASQWLQPMLKALDLPLPEPQGAFESAMSLMPDFARAQNADEPSRLRLLLNFPKKLEVEWLHAALGKASLWKGQFNGVKDKSLFLHWPGTATEAAKRQPWHDQPSILKNGFTLLATDLGQRNAGAWALIKATTWNPVERNPAIKTPVVSIGHDGIREWFAETQKTGMLRLPGEDQMVFGADGKRTLELSGKAGRNASEQEWKEARDLARTLLAEQPENWVGSQATEKSFPEQNDSLINLANRRLSRLSTYHRWSCFDPERNEVAGRKKSLIEQLQEELTHWQEPRVLEWKTFIEAGDFNAFRTAAGEAFASYRQALARPLVELANRVVPLRGRSWQWRQRKIAGTDGKTYHELVDTGEPPSTTPHVRGQRGLSTYRLEQIEDLRTLFLRYNRSFDREGGKPAKFGFADKGRNSDEPCELLLQKLDELKTQRIDQTAHLILAQALGVRLKAHSQEDDDKKARQAADVHGEYEAIPGRQPVDFIVIENLDRYLTSQGRAPSENSRLMKWSHRAIRDKIKMLAEEPFGIPVVEAPAAYSSRFCARTSAPGARCEELDSLKDNQKDQWLKRATAKPELGKPAPQLYATLVAQFEQLQLLNTKRQAANKKPHTLFAPKPGGPLFLTLTSDKLPTQADINAAGNIGLRAIAAPEALHLLHKIRTERKGTSLLCKRVNAREKAAYNAVPIEMAWQEPATPSATKKHKTKLTVPNLFYDGHQIAEFEKTVLSVKGKTIPVATSKSIWSAVNQNILTKIVQLNEARLQRFGSNSPAATPVEPDDDIPM